MSIGKLLPTLRRRFVLKYSGSKQSKKNLMFTSTAVKTPLSRKRLTCNRLLLSDRPYAPCSTTIDCNATYIFRLNSCFISFLFYPTSVIKDYWVYFSIPRYRIFSFAYRGPVRRGQILKSVIGVLEVHKISYPLLSHPTHSVGLATNQQRGARQ